MKKQLLALTVSLTLVSGSALAASVLMSSNGTPVVSTHNSVVAVEPAAAEVAVVKAEPKKVAPKKAAKKAAHKKVAKPSAAAATKAAK